MEENPEPISPYGLSRWRDIYLIKYFWVENGVLVIVKQKNGKNQ
jgi:hypothetical protein